MTAPSTREQMLRVFAHSESEVTSQLEWTSRQLDIVGDVPAIFVRSSATKEWFADRLF